MSIHNKHNHKPDFRYADLEFRAGNVTLGHGYHELEIDLDFRPEWVFLDYDETHYACGGTMEDQIYWSIEGRNILLAADIQGDNCHLTWAAVGRRWVVD